MENDLIKKILLIILFIFGSPVFAADSNKFVFSKGNILMLAPPVINKDYFLLEFGFITEKKVKGSNYNAYVTAALFQDSLDQAGKLKAGGLGFKGGVMIPTQPWVPLLFTMSFGFAKTVLHKNPFLGREDTNAGKKDMVLLEPGLLYHHNKYFLRLVYQVSNVKYFKRHTILTFGVSY